MPTHFLLNIFEQNGAKPAVIWKGNTYNYNWLVRHINLHRDWLQATEVKSGEVTIIDGDFSPNSIAILMALIANGNIIVPILGSTPQKRKEELAEVAYATHQIVIDTQDNLTSTKLTRSSNHELYEQLRRANQAGLVLFTSGSTGKCKAVLHNAARLLDKYSYKRHNLRTLAFLLFDHIGGLDTLFYCLSNGSCIVTVEDKSVNTVCEAVERHRIEVLPVSPSFLSLLLLSQSYLKYDLSSLKFITFGAEVMPESTAQKCAEIFPTVTLLQKYGTTEVGTLRSKSKSSGSVWVRLGGEGYETRVVDGVLQLKAHSAMMGYLNAESPFTEDGWFVTGDSVSVEGEYFRIMGRTSEIINVGGVKVYPVEVESVIQELDHVSEVTVYGETNPVLGNIVCAKVTPVSPCNADNLKEDIIRHCRKRLPKHQIPIKISITNYRQHTDRFKKNRQVGWPRSL